MKCKFDDYIECTFPTLQQVCNDCSMNIDETTSKESNKIYFDI